MPFAADEVSQPRVTAITDDVAPLWLRVVFALQRRLYGAVLEPTRVWAHAPAAMRGFLHLFAAVDRGGSPLEPALRSLVMVKVAQLDACSYCIDINASLLLKRGVKLDKALAVADYKNSPLFTPKERAALDYAVAMTVTGSTVTDVIFAELRRHFDENTIVELTALVSLQNASAKFNAALAIPSQGFCPAVPGPTRDDEHLSNG